MLHIKKIKPLFTTIVTTANVFTEDQIENGIIIAKKGDLKTYQEVVAIGSTVRDVNVGDMAMINVDNYAVRKWDKNSIKNDLDDNGILKYSFNWVKMYDVNDNPRDYLLFNDRDILYTFEGEEKNNVIVAPDKPKLIV